MKALRKVLIHKIGVGEKKQKALLSTHTTQPYLGTYLLLGPQVICYNELKSPQTAI